MTLSRLPTRCRQCKAKFTAEERSRGLVLHSECVGDWVKDNLPKLEKKRVQLAKKRAAEGRRELRERKEKLKSSRDWLNECQAIVNKIARLRDKDKPCVSCDRPASWDGQWHGSHFRSVGAASAVRLNLWNVHKSCSPCNVHLSGNLLNYRPRLIARIGQEKVDWLESQNQIVRYDVEYLKRFKKVMGKRLRRMERRAAE